MEQTASGVMAGMVASEELSAGDFVNLFIDQDEQLRVRKADAAFGDEKKSCGFVRVNTMAGQKVNVHTEGTNDLLYGLTIGTVYFLCPNKPGHITSNPPTISGQFVQPLGMATTPTSMQYTLCIGQVL